MDRIFQMLHKFKIQVLVPLPKRSNTIRCWTFLIVAQGLERAASQAGKEHAGKRDYLRKSHLPAAKRKHKKMDIGMCIRYNKFIHNIQEVFLNENYSGSSY